MNYPGLLAALLAFLALPTAAQQQPAKLPVPRNLQATFTKGTRSEDGKPGPNYWQNTADYTLRVSFDPSTRRVSGTVDIAYQNNSPDALPQLWFKLYPNLYQKGAPRSSGIKPEDVSEGVQIQQLSVNGQAVDVSHLRIDATNMVVPLDKALASKQSANVRVTYAYTLNQGSHTRTGEVEPGAENGSAFGTEG